MSPRFIFFPSQAGAAGGVPVVESYTVTDISTAASTMTVTAPSGIVDNDILIMICAFDHDGTDATFTSTGWTELSGSAHYDNNDMQTVLLWKRASSESGNYTLNWDDDQEGGAFIARISGATTSGSPFDVVGAIATGWGGVATATGITTTVDDTLAFTWVVIDRSYKTNDDETVTGTGWSKLASSYNLGSDGASIIMGTKDMETAGATGGPVIGTFGNDNWGIRVISIKSN